MFVICGNPYSWKEEILLVERNQSTALALLLVNWQCISWLVTDWNQEIGHLLVISLRVQTVSLYRLESRLVFRGIAKLHKCGSPWAWEWIMWLGSQLDFTMNESSSFYSIQITTNCTEQFFICLLLLNTPVG